MSQAIHGIITFRSAPLVGSRAAAIGLAALLTLASVPAVAQVAQVPTTQDSALPRKQYLVETQQAEAVAEQLAIQRQTLDVLREIAADIEALQMRQSRAAP